MRCYLIAESWIELEVQALSKSRKKKQAIIDLVNAFRKYRHAIEEFASKRIDPYGSCNPSDIQKFIDTLDQIDCEILYDDME